jgi:CheY-like chemotaxis protein
MARYAPAPLGGRRLLVAEDEYLVAADLAGALEDLGAEVIGPAATVAVALELVRTHLERIDGAVLDVNLRDERVYPVADALMELGVPFVFTTGYDASSLADAYADVRRCEKPIDRAQLVRMLMEMTAPA